MMNNKLYKLMNWPKIEEIIYSESDNPHELLGPHKAGGQTVVQAFFPGAVEAEIIFDETGEIFPMELADEDGYFAALLPVPEKNVPVYHYFVKDGFGVTLTHGEPYRYAPLITENDTEKFKNGIHYTVYEKLGAHPVTMGGVKGTYFAVWAPSALRVSVVGDFNRWDGRVHQMRRLWDSGIFEIFVPGAAEGDNYKFEIKLKGGLIYLKADPYCNAAQLRPDTASVIANLSDFEWEDAEFLRNRKEFQTGNVPVSVYELYLGSFVAPVQADSEAAHSFAEDSDGTGEGKGDASAETGERPGPKYANYRDIARALIPYVKEMGYTHVELMPVMEHPFDGSWGYQVIGYYAPTARYGSPRDFMEFVNELHKAGIGVILDWVPAHFPRDVWGLSNFDGTCLYEHWDPRKGSHPHWGTLIFNYGRPEVSNYLIANALFWAEKYHVDGIRMDAVASMLYLDYGRKDGEWIPNIYGGKENLEAIELIKHLNSIMKKRNPGVLTIAEESTAFPMITGALEEGGLGFDLKWNMGFMNDYLDYIKYDPYFRSYHHGELTFSMIYAYSEKFMLVFSHDEVVHGKATLIGKMPGEREQKFANLRLTYAYRMVHPGKKLLFMGQDLGEFDEWNEERLVEWNLRDIPEHEGIAGLVSRLNNIYRNYPALYALDDSPEGFEWINNISANDCYLTFARKGKNPDEIVVVVANFAGIPREITTGVPAAGKYKEIFNSDDQEFGGSGVTNSRVKRSKAVEWDDRLESVTVKLAPTALCILQYIPLTEEELAKEREKELEKERKEKEKAEKEQARRERAEKEKAEKEQARREKAEKEQAQREKEKVEREQARREKAEKEKAEKEQARREKEEKEKAEREQARREKAEKEQAQKEQAEKEKAEREKTEDEKIKTEIDKIIKDSVREKTEGESREKENKGRKSAKTKTAESLSKKTTENPSEKASAAEKKNAGKRGGR